MHLALDEAHHAVELASGEVQREHQLSPRAIHQLVPRLADAPRCRRPMYTEQPGELVDAEPMHEVLTQEVAVVGVERAGGPLESLAEGIFVVGLHEVELRVLSGRG